MIRFTKDGFCLLFNSTLSFYTLAGELVSESEVGINIHELFPYRQGVLCIYGDQGVYGKGAGKNILNYVCPLYNPQSFYDIAIQHNLSYDALFARYKPFACINPERNELVLLNRQLEKERSIYIPFHTGNVITFALTFKYGFFIEENKLYVWEFGSTDRIKETFRESSYNIRAIFHRHEFAFIEVSNYKIQLFMPIVRNLLK